MLCQTAFSLCFFVCMDCVGKVVRVFYKIKTLLKQGGG